ncbi:MAG: NAD(P)/FAD-dependent oxidoreductase [Chloroflexi bacterium]|nr:NAD(P)/FAD-dependent oxidoreductase [Chloroflexota bacterium]
MVEVPESVAILGAGSLGLTLAYRLCQAGIPCTVFEQSMEPGGLAAGFRIGDSYLEKFYHHLFRTDHAAIALIRELDLGSSLVWKKPIAASLYCGRIWPLDSPLAVLRFQPLTLPQRFRMGLVIAYLKVTRNYYRFEKATAAAWLSWAMGARPFSVVWEPLLRAKFGSYADDILMSWMWARFHYRTAKLGYLRGGFQLLYNQLVERITRLGGRVHFGESVQRVQPLPSGGFRIQTGTGTWEATRLISTAPTRVTFRLVKELPETFTQRYTWNQAYGAHCVIFELEQQVLPVYWLNITDPGYPFLAAVEHTNLMPASDYGGRHLLYLGNYLPHDHPLFSQPDDTTIAEFARALRRINPAFDSSWIINAHVFKASYAQPIVTAGFAEHIPSHHTPIPGLYIANMFQVYPQDRGQNYSIALANRLASIVLSEIGLTAKDAR